ncbi:hypothetical protein FHR81_001147 [Actinoalloteichus hoggarensis]|uniref:Uncharacterized protein n=1 Tax=Actinoalloteichus hoggarensis TaxID=1470176 RepID=A0A221VZC6_9PSEU|nr:hypothetical protein AHOG_06150 [Actinoalloteichus hoggarensis]MBB5920117.1 hypothetical protein [Actinoalloteichus hoggarensis]
MGPDRSRRPAPATADVRPHRQTTERSTGEPVPTTAEATADGAVIAPPAALRQPVVTRRTTAPRAPRVTVGRFARPCAR